ncbi:branched-chain amino acid ABC transporter permease [Dactylosporangium fulvum]|uniref:Branched-chain amino acid ABC transporter permease n=1 Tax=Dactylosporangium fulvum TaxID=53359 RepID=A0ABY5VR50_9ACTN|nr:branched-chain amino acid ABC transporter permease [Dactylosporangium fulvum]UWP80257.1 branched-chain amino acid ABC transporter permease [Dactylosporangium fulvum]
MPALEPTSVNARTSRGRSGAPLTGWLSLAVALAVVATTANDTVLRTATTVAMFAIAAHGLNVLFGYCRVISLGASAFVGVGAYSCAYLSGRQGVPFVFAVLLAMACSAVLGLVIAPIAARLKGFYLGLATLGLVFVMQYVFTNWASVTGGVSGTQPGPREIGGLSLDTPLRYFVFTAVALLLVTAVTTNLSRSRSGRAMRVLANSPTTARVLGVSPSRYRTYAFVYSSALAGLTGALLVGHQGHVGYEQFGLTISVQLIAAVVIGGLGSSLGAVVGTAIVYGISEIILAFGEHLPLVSASGAGDGLAPSAAADLVYGLLLIVVLTFEPQGLVGLVRRFPRPICRARSRAVS